MKKKKAIAIIAALVIVAGVTTTLLLVFLFPSPGVYTGQRKALICCSANDFFGSEPEEPFNDGHDSNLNNIIKDEGNWSFTNIENCLGQHTMLEAYEGPLNGSLLMKAIIDGPFSGIFSLNWTQSGYTLYEYAYYNISAMIKIIDTGGLIGKGARIGLQWLDSDGDVTRTDWSNYINNTNSEWAFLNSTGVCNNETGKEITELKLVLCVNFTLSIALTDYIFFDYIKIDKWVLVDLDNPTDPGTPPPPPGINSDGFPAQALQVYWILKNHGYTDENIFLMLYYKDDADGIIDIKLGGKPDDLVGAVIDLANNSVNATSFKQELNVSYAGSFASTIQPQDYLIIYMCDHGSNKIPGQAPNATFHFEADNSFITELEFYNLVKQINCQRIMINVDCCFSGNFLNQNIVGQSWYDIENCIMVSASSNLLAWYYINNKNLDGFAGSWFFHMFWDALNQSATIYDAFNHANIWPPAARGMPLFLIQNPMWDDNMGINKTLSFDSDPPL